MDIILTEMRSHWSVSFNADVMSQKTKLIVREENSLTSQVSPQRKVCKICLMDICDYDLSLILEDIYTGIFAEFLLLKDVELRAGSTLNELQN